MTNLAGGKICRKCGVWQTFACFQKRTIAPDGLDYSCKICKSISQKAKYHKNPEKVLQLQRIYRQSKSDKIKGYESQRRNTPERQEYQRTYRLRNKEKLQEYDRIYTQVKSEIKAEHAHKRRSRKRNAEGVFTAEEWEQLKVFYNHTCLCCRQIEPTIRLVPDHVIPLSRGGSNWISNIQPLCVSCNNEKKTKTTDYRVGWDKALPDQ